MGKFGALNVQIGGSEEQAKFGFPVATVTTCKVNFKKSYLTQFWLEMTLSYAQIKALGVYFLGKLISFTDSKYSERYQRNGEQRSFVRKQFQHN